jgi:hypothetical protein
MDVEIERATQARRFGSYTPNEAVRNDCSGERQDLLAGTRDTHTDAVMHAADAQSIGLLNRLPIPPTSPLTPIRPRPHSHRPYQASFGALFMFCRECTLRKCGMSVQHLILPPSSLRRT